MHDGSDLILSFRDQFGIPTPIDLIDRPTPLIHHPLMSRDLGVEVWLKREDMVDTIGCGNKLRKLAHVVAEAERNGATTLVTVGSLPSNQCKSVAFVAALRGLKANVIYGGDHQERPKAACGNYLLTALLGAEVTWCERRPWGEMAEELRRVQDELFGRGEIPWVIPAGASVWPGLAGSIELGIEIAGQAGTAGLVPTHVITPAGSGGTALGLFMAARHLGRPWQVIGMCIGEPAEQVRAGTQALRTRGEQIVGTGRGGGATLTFVEDSRGAGYDQPQNDELATMRDVLRRYGLIFDPNYMTKGFLGLKRAISRGDIARGSRVVLVHTGGQTGLFDGSDTVQGWIARMNPHLLHLTVSP